MRVTAPVTDYLKRSVLNAVGDLLVGDPLEHDRLPAGLVNTILKGQGAGVKPAYELFEGVAGSFLKGKGVDVNPAFERLDGILKHYLKALGAGSNPAFSALRLDDVGVKIGLSTRTEGGAQSISGVGYNPSIVIFIARFSVAPRDSWSIGFDDGSVHMLMYRDDTTVVTIRTNRCIYVSDFGDTLECTITAKDGDGFTLTWIETGDASAEFIYVCLP